MPKGLVGPSQDGGESPHPLQELKWLLKALDYRAEDSIQVGRGVKRIPGTLKGVCF